MSAETLKALIQSIHLPGSPRLPEGKPSQRISREKYSRLFFARHARQFIHCTGIALLGFLFALVALPLRAQTYTASVTGTVTDPSGAVVPGAQVTMTNTSNGYSFKAVTNIAGIYVVLNLRPGAYTLRVAAKGFKTHSRSGITLEINQAATVNAAMELGSSVQTVEVNAAPPIIQAQNAQMGQTITGTLARELPLVGRDVQQLISIAPGVTPAPGGACPVCGGGGDYNVISYGMRNDQMDITLDGATTSGPDFEIHDQEISPNLEAVQEFKIEQNNFSADKGFSGSTVVTMVTRSGTNQFHGEVYEFDRNNKFDANNFFANQLPNPTIPPLHWNDFGGTIGGPIKRNKAFFFFDYDGQRTSSLAVNSFGVPDQAEIKGDFSELCGEPNGPAPGATFDAQGMCSDPAGQLWDPYSGFLTPQGYVARGTIIPGNRMDRYQSPGADLAGTGYSLPAVRGNVIDPVAEKLMQFFPTPNVGAPGTASYNPYDNFLSSGANGSSSNQYDVKIDYMINDKTHLTGRFTHGWSKSTSAFCFDNPANPCGGGPTTPPPHSGQIVLNLTHNIGANKLFTLTYGFTRGGWVNPGASANFPNFNGVTDLGMPAYMNDDKGIKGTPSIYENTGPYLSPGGEALGQEGWVIANVGRENHDLVGSLDWIVGRHDIKFGGEFRALRDNSWGPGTPNGVFALDQYGSTSQDPITGGDFMAGFLSGVSTDGWGDFEIDAAPAELNKYFGGYIEDKWRTTSKLTLSLGLRYDLQLPQTERHNMLSYFNPSVGSPINGQVPAISTADWTYANSDGNTVPMSIPIPDVTNLHGADQFVGINGNSRWFYPHPYYNGWQPRIGLAYRLGDKTVLRAGIAKFFDWYQYGAWSYGVAGDGFTQFTNWLPTYQGNNYTPWSPLSNPWQGPPAGPTAPPGTSLGPMTDIGLGVAGAFDSPGWGVNPSSWNWNFGFQRELPGNILLEANYVGRKGTHLMFGGYVSPNYLGRSFGQGTPDQIADRVAQLSTYVPNPFYGIITDPNSSLSASSVPATQLELPFPQYTGMNFVEPPWANSEYNGLEIRMEKRLSKGLEFVTSYVWSKSIDDSSVQGDNTTWLGGHTRMRDPNDRELERGLSEFNLPQSFQLSYIYNLPFGQGMHWGSKWNGVVNAFLGGWETTGIWTIMTGQPIYLSWTSCGLPIPTWGCQQPDILGPLRKNHGANWMQDYFSNDSQVLREPAPYTLGTGPSVLPNILGPGTANADLAIYKNFALRGVREGMSLQLRLETLNGLNHPQFAAPDTAFESGIFGLISRQINTPRQVQLGAKLMF